MSPWQPVSEHVQGLADSTSQMPKVKGDGLALTLLGPPEPALRCQHTHTAPLVRPWLPKPTLTPRRTERDAPRAQGCWPQSQGFPPSCPCSGTLPATPSSPEPDPALCFGEGEGESLGGWGCGSCGPSSPTKHGLGVRRSASPQTRTGPLGSGLPEWTATGRRPKEGARPPTLSSGSGPAEARTQLPRIPQSGFLSSDQTTDQPARRQGQHRLLLHGAWRRPTPMGSLCVRQAERPTTSVRPRGSEGPGSPTAGAWGLEPVCLQPISGSALLCC